MYPVLNMIFGWTCSPKRNLWGNWSLGNTGVGFLRAGCSCVAKPTVSNVLHVVSCRVEKLRYSENTPQDDANFSATCCMMRLPFSYPTVWPWQWVSTFDHWTSYPSCIWSSFLDLTQPDPKLKCISVPNAVWFILHNILVVADISPTAHRQDFTVLWYMDQLQCVSPAAVTLWKVWFSRVSVIQWRR